MIKLNNTSFNDFSKSLYKQLDESNKFSMNNSGWNALSAKVAVAINETFDMRDLGFENETVENFNVNTLKKKLKDSESQITDSKEKKTISTVSEFKNSVLDDIFSIYKEDVFSYQNDNTKDPQDILDKAYETIKEITMEIFHPELNNPLARKNIDYSKIAFDFVSSQKEKYGEDSLSYAENCSISDKREFSFFDRFLLCAEFMICEDISDCFIEIYEKLGKSKFLSPDEMIEMAKSIYNER